MLKNKKATVLLYIAIFGLILALTIMFTVMATREPVKLQKGEMQLKLLNIYQDAENVLFYVDQTAKYAAQESILELAEKGGFYEVKCGTYEQYNLWKKDCFPDYEENFENTLNKNIDPYLIVHPEVIPPDNYNLIILDNSISGIAEAKLSFYTPGLDRVEYFVSPSFTIGIDHDLNTYKTLIEQATTFMDSCTVRDLYNCIEDNLPTGWTFGSCEGDKTIQNRKARFCIISTKHLTQDSTPITYKFALQFPQPE